MTGGGRDEDERHGAARGRGNGGAPGSYAGLHLAGLTCEPRRVELGSRRLLFGRGADCNVQLQTAQASRQHAQFLRAGTAFMLRDLGSTNGTFIDGVRVSEAELLPNSLVRMGDWLAVSHPGRGTTCDHTFRAHGPNLWGSAALGEALAPARKVATSDMAIALEGETGTGKELVARAIHAWSGRSGQFVAVDCATLPEALAEGELFGRSAAACSGGERPTEGYLRAAHGGTLLLDEITDLPLALQAKLLRVLEQREVVPLGQTQPLPVDVRLVVAAQESLAKAVEQCRFRADLHTRLLGLTIEVPALRERVEDVPGLMARVFAELPISQPPTVSTSALEALCLYDWPFNVRELRLLAQRLAIALGPGAEILRKHLPERIARRGETGWARDDAPRDPKAAELDEFLSALRTHGGNVLQAARALGITRTRAYRLMSGTT